MRTKPQGGAKDDFVKDGRGRVDDELAALGGLDDSAQIAGVHFHDGNGALFAQKAPGADWIAVAAPNGVALPLQKLREKGAGCPRSQNEDPHGVEKTLPQYASSPEGRVGIYHANLRLAGSARGTTSLPNHLSSDTSQYHFTPTQLILLPSFYLLKDRISQIG